MPHLFWTVTADEVSDLKWQSIRDMEELLKRFSAGFTFQVRHACACDQPSPNVPCDSC